MALEPLILSQTSLCYTPISVDNQARLWSDLVRSLSLWVSWTRWDATVLLFFS